MKIGKILRDWRTSNQVGIRTIAKEIGVGHATLSRIERGKPVDGQTLMKLIRYLF